jgi:peptidoglycan biosynthesis protein MviN/MurJ (putative lipid II flippase)
MIGAGWVDMAFASLAGVGGIATLEFAQRLTNVAPGVASNSITSVYYTEFASALAEGDKQRFRDAMRDAFRASLFFSVPMAVLIATLRDPLVTLVLEHGAFSRQAAETAQAIVLILSILLPVNALLGVSVSSVFSDPGHRHILVITSSAAISITIRVAVAASLIATFGVLAVPLSSLLSMTVMLAALQFWQARRMGSPVDLGSLRIFGAILLAGMFGGALAWLCKEAWAPLGDGRVALVGLLLVAGSVGAAGFFFVTWIFKIDEAEIIARRVKKTLNRKSR